MPSPYKTVNTLMERYDSVAEAGAQELTEAHIKRLNKRCDLLEDLGIVAGADNKIPTTEGQPRIFVIEKDNNGVEGIWDLETAKCPFGTKAFWEQVQRGNVFAYAAGEKDPRQLRVAQNGGKDPSQTEVAYSKPIPPEQMPKPNKIPVISGWQRFWRRFGFYKKQAAARRAYENGQANITNEADKISKARGKSTGTELKDVERQKEIVKQEKKKEQNKEAYENAELYTKEVARRRGNMISMLKPHPEHRDELNKEKSSIGYGIYNSKTFQELENFTDFNSAQIKIGGKPLTDEEFAAVCFFAATRPKSALQTYALSESYDPTAPECLKQRGLNQEETDYAISAGYSNMYTIDMLQDEPRDGAGRFFEKGIKPVRREVKEAFEKYAAGEPEKLAEILAESVNMASRETVQVEGAPKTESYATYKTASDLLGLLERDPKLAKQAEEKGMKPENLNALKGLRELEALYEDRLKAERDLKKAIHMGTPMSEKQKQDCAMKILRSRLAEKKITAENNSYKNEKIDRLSAEIMKNTQTKTRDLMGFHPDLRQNRLEPGKIWFDTAHNATEKIRFLHMPVPPTAANMHSRKPVMERICNQICKDLDVGKLDPEQLKESLEGYKLDKAVVAATEKVQAQRNGVELEAENRKPVIERNRESLNIQASQVLS